jgi:hypothetical protein
MGALKKGDGGTAGTGMPGAADFRAALQRALEEAGEDERIGPMICATRLRLRFEFTDSGLALNVAASDDGPRLLWSFGSVSWEPKLTLAMSTAVANRYLLGRESLAIAIARGEVRVRGESRAALLYLPAARLISEPYRNVVERAFPALAAT